MLLYVCLFLYDLNELRIISIRIKLYIFPVGVRGPYKNSILIVCNYCLSNSLVALLRTVGDKDSDASGGRVFGFYLYKIHNCTWIRIAEHTSFWDQFDKNCHSLLYYYTFILNSSFYSFLSYHLSQCHCR